MEMQSVTVQTQMARCREPCCLKSPLHNWGTSPAGFSCSSLKYHMPCWTWSDRKPDSDSFQPHLLWDGHLLQKSRSKQGKESGRR